MRNERLRVLKDPGPGLRTEGGARVTRVSTSGYFPTGLGPYAGMGAPNS